MAGKSRKRNRRAERDDKKNFKIKKKLKFIYVRKKKISRMNGLMSSLNRSVSNSSLKMPKINKLLFYGS